MEKSFDLTPKELQAFSALEQDNLRANATYGVLARQMKDTEQKIAQSEEAQRSFVRTAIQNRGVEQFQNAKIEPPGRITYIPLEDTPATQMGVRPNGGDFNRLVEGSESAK